MARTKENNTILFVALGAAALALVAAIVWMKFMTKPLPPPPPTALPTPEVLPTKTPLMYRGVLEDDSKRFGLPVATPETLAAPLAHTNELDVPRALKPGESFETEHLKLQASVVKEWAKNESGQGFRFDHLVLTITNKTDAPLAYRVDTQVTNPEKCSSKAALPHNALALKPGEKVERTECLYRPGMTLTLMAIETLRLPPLGYFYVSRLIPTQIGLDKRTATGHAPPKETSVCKYIPWRDIEASGASWADVVDFYARHNCDEFSFLRGYRLRTAPGPLPAVEGSGGAAPAPAPPPAPAAGTPGAAPPATGP